MTGWISLFATLLLQSGISSRVRGSRLDIAELFQLSDRICRGPLTPIFCRIVLRVWIKKIQFYSLASAKYQPTPFFFLVLIFFFRYRLYVTMQQGKKPLVQKRSNMSSSPSYAIQQKIIFWKKYIVVIHVMFQSLVSWQLQTTKNVIGSPIIRYNTIFIQYSKFVLSISQLPKNRYTYLIIYFGQGNFKQEGIKVILVFYFHNFSPPSFFSHENQYTTILIYTQTSI